LVFGTVQLNFKIFSLILYFKSLTCGGLSPLGGSGGPLAPQPPMMIVAARQSITVKALMLAGFIFKV
jgi:hypothetical protein